MTTIAIPTKADWRDLNFGAQLQLSGMIALHDPVNFENAGAPEQSLLDEMAALGYLTKTGEGETALYKLTTIGAELASDIPECMRPGFVYPETFGF